MPNIVLNYFNGRGRAELSRLICAASNIQYTDARTEFQDWPQKKSSAPLGSLPVLNVDGVEVPQSIAIARYLALEGNLVGRTNLEQLKADAIVHTVYDAHNVLANEAIRFLVYSDLEGFAAGLKRFSEVHLNKHFGNIEKLISLYGQNGYSVGNALTWADLYIYDMHSKIVQFYKDDSLLSSFERVGQVVKRVEENANIAAYLKTRPDSIV